MLFIIHAMRSVPEQINRIQLLTCVFKAFIKEFHFYTSFRNCVKMQAYFKNYLGHQKKLFLPVKTDGVFVMKVLTVFTGTPVNSSNIFSTIDSI